MVGSRLKGKSATAEKPNFLTLVLMLRQPEHTTPPSHCFSNSNPTPSKELYFILIFFILLFIYLFITTSGCY